MHRIMSVGIATLDIVNVVEEYPGEDSEVRAISHHVRRGGNAANTADALAQLGHESRWLGVLADDPDASHITGALEAAGVDYTGAPVIRGGKVPTSYITLSRATGSRTIVHYRDLRELAAEDFSSIDLDGVEWLHFEGRDPASCLAMIADARRRAPGVRISAEIEKPRPEIDALAPAADVVFYSRAYAESLGYRDGESFLNGHVRGVLGRSGMAGGRSTTGGSDALPGSGTPATTAPPVFCAWGAGGAWLRLPDGTLHHEPPRPVERIEDTIGAGDVFNAAAIHVLAEGGTPLEAIREANRIAAKKCTLQGITIHS